MFERQKARMELGLFNEKCHHLSGLTSGLLNEPGGILKARRPIYLEEFKKMTTELKRLMDDEATYLLVGKGAATLNKEKLSVIDRFVRTIKQLTDRWFGMVQK